MKTVFRFALLVLASVSMKFTSAQGAEDVIKTKENFMVVVRESTGANRIEDLLKPTGKQRAKLADGKEIELDMAHWEFIGDTHIRFVFDGPQTMMNATPQDLDRIGVKDVDEALGLALKNIKRTYGEPKASSLDKGIMQVQGKSPDLDSSYFLDRDFWSGLEKKHPEGLVVSVAKRGGLLYAPFSDGRAVNVLKENVAKLHASSQRMRISSALFLFKDGKWTVFQPAVKQ
jgi:hypothetical protein